MSGPRPVTPALLRKLVTCGECGAPLYVTKGGKSGARHYYYRCASGGPCVVYHRVERVDAAVRSAVEEWLRRPANLRAAAERDRPEDEAAEAREAAEKATTELRDLDRQEERVARLLRRALISEATGEKQLGEIARLRATAEAERASAEARAHAASRRGKVSAEMEARIASLREGLAHATADDWRALLEILFPRTAATGIRLHPDGEITLAGALSLDATGEAAMARAGRAPAEATVIPLRLRAHR